MTTATVTEDLRIQVDSPLQMIKALSQHFNDADKEEAEFMGFISWIQTSNQRGYVVHRFMRSLLNTLYSRNDTSYFGYPVEVGVIDFQSVVEDTFNEDGSLIKVFVYEAEVEATIPLNGEEVTVTFYIRDYEPNPSVEAMEQMSRIIEIAVQIAMNGQFTPIGLLADYAELTSYLPDEV